MSAELGAVAAAAPVPLLTAQVRMVKNEGESSNNCFASCRAVRTKVICKNALAQIITSVTLSNRRSTRCRRSSAPSPPPHRYRYLLRRCAWSRTKGNPQTTNAECKLVSSNCDDRRRVTCLRCPSSFPRMHSASACQRVTAAASPRCVPTELRK